MIRCIVFILFLRSFWVLVLILNILKDFQAFSSWLTLTRTSTMVLILDGMTRCIPWCHRFWAHDIGWCIFTALNSVHGTCCFYGSGSRDCFSARRLEYSFDEISILIIFSIFGLWIRILLRFRQTHLSPGLCRIGGPKEDCSIARGWDIDEHTARSDLSCAATVGPWIHWVADAIQRLLPRFLSASKWRVRVSDLKGKAARPERFAVFTQSLSIPVCVGCENANDWPSVLCAVKEEMHSEAVAFLKEWKAAEGK